MQIGPLRRAHHYAIVDVFVLGGNGRIQLTGISNLDRPRVDRDRQLPVLKEKATSPHGYPHGDISVLLSPSAILVYSANFSIGAPKPPL